MNIAVIPARGGKRIPPKKPEIILWKPIIAYSIEAAKTSGLFDHIIVSTDDEEIVKTALLMEPKPHLGALSTYPTTTPRRFQ